MAFLPSLPTRPVGSQHPFKLGLSTCLVALSLLLLEGLRLLPGPLPSGYWPALQPVESVA